MEALAPEKLTHNAFRVLGVGGDATQEAIHQAARRMRLWASSGKAPATPWDLPWLGPIGRAKQDIEQAVAKLNEPNWRVQERMLWFCGSAEVLAWGDVSTIREALRVSRDESTTARQNRAVADLAEALFQPLPIDPKTWGTALESFTRLCNSDDHLRWQLESEKAGGFEKPATEAEISQFQRAIPQMIAASLDRHVEAALDEENVQDAAAFLQILRGAGTKSQQRILDRLEEMLERRCRSAESDLRAGIKFQQAAVETNHATCIGVREFFDKSIAPLRRDLMKLAGDEYERIRRIRWQCARILAMLGTGWIFALQFVIAEETLNEAMGNAQGTAQENEIREQMRENQRRAAQQRQVSGQQRQVYQVAQAAPSQGGPTQGGVYAIPYRGSGIVGPSPAARPKPVRQPMDGNRGFWGAIIAVIIFGLRFFAASGTGSSSATPSRPPPQNYYQPSYNPPPPQKQPSWTPSRPQSPTYPQNPSPRSPQPYRSGRR